mgnify:CR=1 FL=1
MQMNYTMKITRKTFLRQSLMALVGIGLLPKAFSLNLKAPPGLVKKWLGDTGIQVTTLGFGASRTQEPAVLKMALDKGITFLDTGRSYANGQNEEMIGSALKGIRQQYVIQSKMKVDAGNDPKRIRSQMETSLQESLEALQTDYIDVMLLHGVRDQETIQNETIRKVFTEMKNRGQIRACGFSSHTNHVPVLTEANTDHFFDVAMVPFNPFGGFKHSRSGWATSWDQEELIRQMMKAHQQGTGIVAMKTCSGGPYAFYQQDQASLPGAVKWVLSQDFVDTSAVAMASFKEIQDHTG